MSMNKSNETIGNRTRDLPACSTVPQPTAPPTACPRTVPYTSKMARLKEIEGEINGVFF